MAPLTRAVSIAAQADAATDASARKNDGASNAPQPIALRPVWDLRARTAATFFCETPPESRNDTGATVQEFDPIGRAARTEIALLKQAATCANRIRAGGQIGAVGATVSFDTLSRTSSRAAYLATLHALDFRTKAPLILKLTAIPADAPSPKVAELVNLVSAPFVVTVVQAADLGVLIDVGAFRGAAGYGLTFEAVDDVDAAERTADNLVRFADSKGGFAFIEHLNTPPIVNAAARKGVRFGSGKAFPLTPLWLDGDLPKLPLRA